MTSLEVIEERLRNLDDSIRDWHRDIKEHLAEEFGIIKTKQDKTNGRVTSLEKWRSWTVGFAACFTLILLPIALKYFTQLF